MLNISWIIPFSFFFIFIQHCTLNEPSESIESLEVVFFDVGQGDASCFWTNSHQVGCIDVGPRQKKLAESLSALKISRISHLYLTHEDLDHIGGLPELLERIEVDSIFTSSQFQIPDWLETTWKNKGLAKKWGKLSSGDQKKIFPIRLQVLWPPSEYVSSENNQSLVIQLIYNQMRILYTGDIEWDAEKELIASSQFLQSQILKVPHHGSNTSSSGAFIQAVSPIWAVFSAEKLIYGHPTTETLARYQYFGLDTLNLFNTEKSGDIHFSLSSKGIRLTEKNQ